MATATPEILSMPSLEAAKAALRAQFEAEMARVPVETLMRAAAARTPHKALTIVVDAPKAEMSIETRNQQAAMRMSERSFERLQNMCSLLEASDVTQILGITKQALSKKAQHGHVIAYTHKGRKFYPEFQFKNNWIDPKVKYLWDKLDIEQANTAMVNVLVKFLVQNMDFSKPGEDENLHPRYTLLDNPRAFDAIAFDFKNRLTHGK